MFKKVCVHCSQEFLHERHSAKYCEDHSGIWVYRARSVRARKRAEQYGLTEHYTEWELLELFTHYGWQCMCCGSEGGGIMGMVADHIVPLSVGGKNLIENIQILCFGCNVSKRNRIIDYRPDPAKLRARLAELERRP